MIDIASANRSQKVLCFVTELEHMREKAEVSVEFIHEWASGLNDSKLAALTTRVNRNCGCKAKHGLPDTSWPIVLEVFRRRIPKRSDMDRRLTDLLMMESEPRRRLEVVP